MIKPEYFTDDDIAMLRFTDVYGEDEALISAEIERRDQLSGQERDAYNTDLLENPERATALREFGFNDKYIADTQK